MSPSAHSRALEDFEARHSELLVIGVDTALARHAGELAEDLELGGYDAVHLASAFAFGADTTLVTWDQDLGRVAVRVGCAVAPAA